MTDGGRGAGRLKGAFGQVRRNEPTANTDRENGAASMRSVRRRRRQKVGKRSKPEVYAQASGFVKREVLARLEQAMVDSQVRSRLESELVAAGIEHKGGTPDYGALCELLIEEWLEANGYGPENTG